MCIIDWNIDHRRWLKRVPQRGQYKKVIALVPLNLVCNHQNLAKWFYSTNFFSIGNSKFGMVTQNLELENLPTLENQRILIAASPHTRYCGKLVCFTLSKICSWWEEHVWLNKFVKSFKINFLFQWKTKIVFYTLLKSTDKPFSTE